MEEAPLVLALFRAYLRYMVWLPFDARLEHNCLVCLPLGKTERLISLNLLILWECNPGGEVQIAGLYPPHRYWRPLDPLALPRPLPLAGLA